MFTNLSEIVGWAGTVLYIVAYLFLSIGKLKSERIPYHLLNLLGAVGLIVNSLYYKSYPSVFVNIAWLIIALFTILIIIRKRRRRSAEAVE